MHITKWPKTPPAKRIRHIPGHLLPKNLEITLKEKIPAQNPSTINQNEKRQTNPIIVLN